MNWWKKIYKHWYIIIGIIIFLYIIFYLVDISEIKNIIIKSNIFLISLAFFLVIIMILLQSWRWNYLKKIQGLKYSLSDSFLIFCAGVFWGIITPGRLGDIIKIVYLQKDGSSVGKSAVSVIIDRLADLLFLLVIGYVSMFFFLNFFSKQLVTISVLFALIIITGLLLQNKLIKILLKKLFFVFVPDKYQKSWHLNFQDFMIDLKNYTFSNYLVIFLITIIIWIIYYLQMFFLIKSIGISNISFTYLIMAVTIAAVTTLIPISINGIGTRDATLLFLFSLVGISSEKTIAFSIMILFLLLVNGLIGFFCWLKKPLNFYD